MRRSLATQMPSMKRCNAEEPCACGEEPPGSCCKRRRRIAGEFPIEVEGDAVGVPCLSSSGRGDPVVRRGGMDVSCSGEVESNQQRSHMVRTSRGRALPSRFKDSVILDPSEKDNPTAQAFDSEFPMDKDRAHPSNARILHKNPSPAIPSTWFKKGTSCQACENSTSGSTLASIDENSAAVTEGVSPTGIDSVQQSIIGGCSEAMRVPGHNALCEDVAKPVGFVPAEIFWANTGESRPVWPSVVIRRADQSAYVLLLGYSSDANRRVNSFQVYIYIYIFIS